MGFVGKPGICIECKRETMIVSKQKCKICYMKEYNSRPRTKKRKQQWEKEARNIRPSYLGEKTQMKENDGINNILRRKLKRASRFIYERTGEFVAVNTLKEILERDNYTCQYCGATRDLSFDHATPVSDNGKSTKENLVTACFSCNSLKSNMNVKQFKEIYFKVTSEEEENKK